MEGSSEEFLTHYYKQLIWDEMREFHPELPVSAPLATSNPRESALLSPAMIAYNYQRSLTAAGSSSTTPDSNNSSSSPFIASISPPQQLSLHYGSNDENHYGANGPSSVATVITTKTNITASNAIREMRVPGHNPQTSLPGIAAVGTKRMQGVTTPMSPPTSLPSSKRFKPIQSPAQTASGP